MTNPFENPEAEYLVLVNEEKQYSLWPKFAEVPAGWTSVHANDRASCIGYINSNWTEMRPHSLVQQMNTAA
ncbi:MbtH family protein [Streptomyces sp. NBC_01304]|uniref:MbtH family protein n=1 Tax=Streptomyces sp. NBC_01304 TaxID=2903818 RepID=UPI002E130705|nr:MbtH family protein [Streptomyces sp. NBC_01304]